MTSKQKKQKFHQAYQRYQKQIYNYVFTLTRNQTITEDIVSSVFVKLLKNIDKLKSEKHLAGWLHLVAKNLVIDNYRQRKRKTTMSELQSQMNNQASEEFLVDLNKTYTDHLSQAIKNEKLKMLQKAFHKLTIEEYTLVYLRYYQELPFKQIAVLYNKEEAAIKMSLYRTLKKIKSIINTKDG